ncbi:MAG TPA: phosphatase PAP2 family protein [Ignavibacteria bacterium]|nr:phosphatase PAP2 family protein [Ignavibacteria bacterium]HRF66900.1 phosphatase PAP2 family protein [Ignavibacteria bacterium]HRJ04623.1 phosphatase PAP2 family protein [Ignavibacteria bacterium]
MPINIKTILILICLPIIVYGQDTINFKLFDSLKTNAEDKHKTINFAPGEKSDTVLKTFKTDPDNFDVHLFRKINNSRSPFKTRVFNTFDRSMLPVAIMLPPSLFIYSRVKRHTYDENSAYLLSLSEFTNISITFGLKLFIQRDRPLTALQKVHTKGMPFLDVYSFPSGHSSTTFAMATSFALRYPKYPQVYAPMYLWALVTAYGRPYFGLHYPSDLLAGAIIGSGSSILIYSLRKELFALKNQVLGEDKSDEGSINGGVLTFFGASFALSAIVNNFLIKADPDTRLSISPWMDNKRGGVNVKWKL